VATTSAGMNIQTVRTAPRSPWQNGYAESSSVVKNRWSEPFVFPSTYEMVLMQSGASSASRLIPSANGSYHPGWSLIGLLKSRQLKVMPQLNGAHIVAPTLRQHSSRFDVTHHLRMQGHATEVTDPQLDTVRRNTEYRARQDASG
jgi:hypothetical protein